MNDPAVIPVPVPDTLKPFQPDGYVGVPVPMPLKSSVYVPFVMPIGVVCAADGPVTSAAVNRANTVEEIRRRFKSHVSGSTRLWRVRSTEPASVRGLGVSVGIQG